MPTGEHDMTYQQRIATIVPEYDARHVEALMRAECGGTLDSISAAEFTRAAKESALSLVEFGADMAERLARSYGL
jgi:hypothetical protein